MQLLRLLILILTSLLLISCSNSEDAKYKPVVNPDPKYFMRIRGKIDPSLNGKIKLILQFVYYSNNSQCEVVVNKVEGVSVQRQITDEKKIIVNSQGKFQYQLALDKYKKGFCDWEIGAFGYSITNNLNNKYLLSPDDIRTGISFDNTSNNDLNKFEQVWKCSSISCVIKKDDLEKLKNYGVVTPTQNYNFILNVE